MNTNRTEQWKDIKGFEGYYQVSNKGHVRSLNYNNRKGNIHNLRPGFNKSTGYLGVSLRKRDEDGNTVIKQTTVHRLVAEAFVPNPNGLEQVDHIDGNRTRNTVSNLRWTTRKKNNSRKSAKLLKSQNHSITSHSHQFVKASKDEEVRYFKNANIASKNLGFSHVLAVKVLRGEFKSAKGWTLEYIDRMSNEGLKSNIDLRTRHERKLEMRKALIQKRKERVRQLCLLPKDAHAIKGFKSNGEVLSFTNRYQASIQLKLNMYKILDCLLGIIEKTNDGTSWKWSVE